MSFGNASSFNAFGSMGTTAIGMQPPTAGLWQPAAGWSPLSPCIRGPSQGQTVIPSTVASDPQAEVTVGDGYYTVATFAPGRSVVTRHSGRQQRAPSTSVAAQTQQRRSRLPLVIGGVVLALGAWWLLKPSRSHA